MGSSGVTTPQPQIKRSRAQDHQRHRDLVEDALEIQPAPHDQRDHDRDERQHNVEVADDRVFHRGFFGEPDDILCQEHLKTIAKERAGMAPNRAEITVVRAVAKNAVHFQIQTRARTGIGLIKLVDLFYSRAIARSPGVLRQRISGSDQRYTAHEMPNCAQSRQSPGQKPY